MKQVYYMYFTYIVHTELVVFYLRVALNYKTFFYNIHPSQLLKCHATFEQVKNDRVKPLTMLMYKSQPRHHLKHDGPNFIL